MNDQSPEHGWIRTWLDTTFELPFGAASEDNLDLGGARARSSTMTTVGLDDVKERIVEHLAVRKLRDERGLESARRSAFRRDSPAGRPSGSGQDVARRVRGAGAGTIVSSEWPWADCATRPRFEDIDARMWAHDRGALPGR